jgi:hypothetical protein
VSSVSSELNTMSFFRVTFVQSYICGNMLGCYSIITDPCVLFYATEIVGSVSCEFLHDCPFGGDK